MKTTVYLDDAEYRRLKRIADREHTSAAELIRAAISAYLARSQPEELPDWVGMLEGDATLAGTDEDELLDGFGECGAGGPSRDLASGFWLSPTASPRS